MSAHPAYPTRRDLRVDNAAHEIAGHDMASAQTMRDALLAVTAKIKALPFLCGSPSRGYDVPDVLALIADITPACDAAYREQLDARAYEIARDAQNERERDAAEYRAELAREDVR